jgi:predicted NBD/HSP70 family sugar kinase
MRRSLPDSRGFVVLFLADVGWSRVRVARIAADGSAQAVRYNDARESMEGVLEQLTDGLSELGCASGARVAVAWNGVVADGCVTASGRGSGAVALRLREALGADVRVWNDAHAAGWCAVSDHGAREAVIAVLGSSLGRAYVTGGAVIETPGAGELLSVQGCSCGEERCIGSLPGGVRFARHVARVSGRERTNEELRSAWDAQDEVVRESFKQLWERVRMSVFEPAVLTGAETVFLGGTFGASWFEVFCELWELDAEKLRSGGRHVPLCVALGSEPVQRGLSSLVRDDARWA